MQFVRTAVLSAMFAAIAPAVAFAQQCNDEESFLVRVKSTFVHEDGDHDPDPRSGTGFLVTNDGWVVTAAHVVRNSGMWSRSGPIRVALLCSQDEPVSWLAASAPIFFDDIADSDFDIAAFQISTSLAPQLFSTLTMASLDNAGLTDRRFTVRGFGDGAWAPIGESGLSYAQLDTNPNIMRVNGQLTNGHSGSPLRNEHKQAVGVVYSVSNTGEDRFRALLFRGTVAEWVRRTTGALVNNDAAPVRAAAPTGMTPATPPSSEFAPGYVFMVNQNVRLRQCGNLFNLPGEELTTNSYVARTFTEDAFNASMSQAPAAVSRLVVQALGESIARVSVVEMTIESRDYMTPDPANPVRQLNPACMERLQRLRQRENPNTSQLEFVVPLHLVIRSSAPTRIRYTLLNAEGAAINIPPDSQSVAADGWRLHRLNDRSMEVVRDADSSVPLAYTAFQTYVLSSMEGLGEVSGPPRARLRLADPTLEQQNQLSAVRN